jgi:secondary thiamine-phosphate synthase enzyme
VKILKTQYTVIKLQTKEKYQFIDLTEEIQKAVRDSKIANGIINIVSRHTTTAILLNENEPLLLDDFIEAVENLIDDCRGFKHNDLKLRRKICLELPKDECQNAEAHCRSIFLTNSQTLNIIDGRLDLGRWQKILFLEIDRAKEREVSVMILGV